MEDRLSPLIEERAPWLFRPGVRSSLVKPLLDRVLRYRECVDLGEALDPFSAEDIMAKMQARLSQRVTLKGLSNIPASGPALIVANHPTGIADAIMLNHALSPIRQDAYYFANRDIMRVMPQFETM
ncbi:MAG: 1-acyl-sn-glycerol-3-phosphate acyltransferase, partial [Pseudomonadota bacterium]